MYLFSLLYDNIYIYYTFVYTFLLHLAEMDMEIMTIIKRVIINMNLKPRTFLQNKENVIKHIANRRFKKDLLNLLTTIAILILDFARYFLQISLTCRNAGISYCRLHCTEKKWQEDVSFIIYTVFISE